MCREIAQKSADFKPAQDLLPTSITVYSSWAMGNERRSKFAPSYQASSRGGNFCAVRSRLAARRSEKRAARSAFLAMATLWLMTEGGQ